MTKWQKIMFDLKRVPATAKIFFLQNLSVMVKAGIPLADGLQVLSEQTKNKKLKIILADVYGKIKEGKTLHESLLPYHQDFGEMFINMINAGELSGRLENVLHELYIQTKKDHLLVTKIRNAMAYPAIILVAMVCIGTFAIMFILPNIVSIFKDLNANLPLTTRILIWVGTNSRQYGPFFIVGLLIIVLLFIRILRTPKGKYWWDRLILKIPIVSGIVKQISLARVAQSLSAMIRTDIAIVDTLKITSRVVNNTLYRQALEESAEKVKKGQKLNVVLRDYPAIFPPIMSQMVMVGEDSGALDEVMSSLSEFYDEEVSQTMSNLPIIIEPLLIILIGLGVAGIAIGVLMPIYSLADYF